MSVSLVLQDAVYDALKDVANGAVFYDVPDDQPLPYVYFGDDDIVADYDQGGDFWDATANVEIYAPDKITLKALVGQATDALWTKLDINGFDVLEWRVGIIAFRTMGDGMTQQASLEFDYLIQPAN